MVMELSEIPHLVLFGLYVGGEGGTESVYSSQEVYTLEM